MGHRFGAFLVAAQVAALFLAGCVDGKPSDDGGELRDALADDREGSGTDTGTGTDAGRGQGIIDVWIAPDAGEAKDTELGEVQASTGVCLPRPDGPVSIRVEWFDGYSWGPGPVRPVADAGGIDVVPVRLTARGGPIRLELGGMSDPLGGMGDASDRVFHWSPSTGGAPLILPQGGTIEGALSFWPPRGGSWTGALELTADLGDGYGGITHRIDVLGTGLGGLPRLTAIGADGAAAEELSAVSLVDMGAVPAGVTTRRLFRLDNLGDGPLVVLSARTPPGFETSLGSPVLPMVVPPGDGHTFEVRFVPLTGLAQAEGFFEIQTRDLQLSVALRGTQTPFCTDAPPTPPEIPAGYDCEDLAAEGPGLCLGSGRFWVTAAFLDTDCARGFGREGASGPRSGALWFEAPDRWALLVELRNRCVAEGWWHVRAAGATQARVVLRVTELLTGNSRIWFSPLGQPFAPILEEEAFACP